MKSVHALLVLLMVVVSGSTVALQAAVDQNQTVSSNPSAPAEETPAQQSITAAKSQLMSDPKRVQAYNELALGYLRRSRETADPKYLRDASDALMRGLKLDPADFALQRTQVSISLADQHYAQALQQAQALHRRNADDVMTYGYLAEANLALGNYGEAETNAQWMMNLRPNNTPALLIGATLRTLFGDPRGAIEFLNRAYSQTSPAEVEEQAWIANRIATIEIDASQIDAAAHTLQQAQQLFPNYPYTAENMARVRMAQNRPLDAVALWKQAAQSDPDPHVLYSLAKAQQAAGLSAEGQETVTKFERLASNPETSTGNSRLDLILMYAANSTTAPTALKLAQQQIAARQDVWTLDAYAWALFANGKYQDADVAIQKAMAVGIQSAQIFDHAGHIAQKLNRSAAAAGYFKSSIQSNPTSEFAADALNSANLDTVLSNSAQKDGPVGELSNLSPVATPDPSAGSLLRKASSDFSAASGPAVFAAVPQSLLTPHPTGTVREIQTAQAALARDPKNAPGYASLGAAYFQHARETGDVSDFQLAEDSLRKSLDLVSADFSAGAALETMAEVCMGEHRFSDAIVYAQKALSLGTGDISPFAILGDAFADMGEYDKAAAAYGRLTPRDMTLSPRAAYARDSRVAYLKFIAGNTGDAIALMKTAVTEGVEAQLTGENLGWLYYELGEFYTQAGDAANADASYTAALNAHPGDYRVLAALGKLRANHGKYEEAIVLYQSAIAIVPMPTFIAELGDLYAKSGNPAEARKQYALVEYIGLLGHINQVLHNRDLATFYADHDMKLTEALDLAKKEFEVRHDVYTWDTLAWALYKNGKLDEAAQASVKALRFGTRDSLILFHAGMIADRLGDSEKARSELNEALQINPHFHLIYATTAHQRLIALQSQSEKKAGTGYAGR